ncbi:hypothetical protein SDC9_62814 [bioreactor metagenome]|uniref:Uncharacterized protein n=1 Tax=bioreactor metagenome TaxID=1076179 RepID=A0A644XQM9_9ZZZZ
MAAWTVAFGVYAIAEKMRSFAFRFVPETAMKTAIIRKIKAPKIRATAAKPAPLKAVMSTADPTKTNRKISAPDQILANLSFRRLASSGRLFNKVAPTAMTPNKPENGMNFAKESSVATNRKQALSTSMTFIVSRMWKDRKRKTSPKPTSRPPSRPKAIETGTESSVIAWNPLPVYIPMNEVNRTMT